MCVKINAVNARRLIYQTGKKVQQYPLQPVTIASSKLWPDSEKPMPALSCDMTLTVTKKIHIFVYILITYAATQFHKYEQWY